MHPRCFRFPESVSAVTALALALLVFGCGDSSGVGKTFPVTGKITLDDELVTSSNTVVLFKPDAKRGNTSPFEPAGTVDSQGNYTLATKGKSGAPPGWYKVTITAAEPRGAEEKGPKNHRPGPRSLLPARYGQAATTPVAIEVVESPASGAYDLKLTSK